MCPTPAVATRQLLMDNKRKHRDAQVVFPFIRSAVFCNVAIEPTDASPTPFLLVLHCFALSKIAGCLFL